MYIDVYCYILVLYDLYLNYIYIIYIYLYDIFKLHINVSRANIALRLNRIISNYT